MRDLERTPGRRTMVLTLLAAITATGALAAVGGSELGTRPVGAVTGPAQVGAESAAAPSATATALALQLAAGMAGSASPAPQPTGAPAPPATDPTGGPAPGVMPCCPSPPPCGRPGAQALPDPCNPGPGPAPTPCPAAGAGGQGDGRGIDEGRADAPLAGPCPRWVMLTERDSGRTITVAPGTWILVRLEGGGVWTEPATSDATVVARQVSGHAHGGSYGGFRTASAGTAELTAMQQPACAPRCRVVTREWTVRVVVTH